MAGTSSRSPARCPSTASPTPSTSPPINGGRHVAPLFAGDTVYAWSEISDTADIPGRSDVGALRIRTVATKNQPCAAFPDKAGEGYDPAVILDLDYWALMAL